MHGRHRRIGVSALLAEPGKTSLPSLVFQVVGDLPHRLNAECFYWTSTRREKAAALAWVIIAMVNPYVENELLWVENPKDQDILCLCSEILGVGGALELQLLISATSHGRTIRKWFQWTSTLTRTALAVADVGRC